MSAHPERCAREMFDTKNEMAIFPNWELPDFLDE